ncbi:chromosome segregation protein SMC [Roseitalea porphyridii]|uniref:Chromosome partition protein Smc n=1 Tax=Roseitalea porphyridii TaxID=1852022 RepID=A0A4V1A3R5_9HYPH|nr:chromosome segregation protein SMC [Roseitalea porphyridii]QBK30038.1 chromosome segregation protein SMC [Roseitalea porphyridii]
MRFEKLRLTGFKSFVEPTEFIIEGGLTGVVGPNGCGKSNLVEALRWVMGESSYKNMRASGMDDVIFSGSATRPSRNMAEVSLFLDNASRTAPAAFNEDDKLQVTRRIEREAGSAYKINGRDARARDVQLLFADQSTGARSPSMVGQGRIGELIQAKPQARRALLEEAAGISGLHSRRHEAELRLRAAETNLERLDDVVAELESQIESLKRQARQANRFRTLSRDIRAAEATLLHLKWAQAKTVEADAQSALSAATAQVAERAQQQMEAARLQAIAQKALPPLREAEAETAAALQRLTIARDQIDAEVERLAARRREYEQRLEQLGADMARERRLTEENAGMVAALDAENAELVTAEEGEEAREAELAGKVEQARQALEKSEAELARATEARAETAALRTQLERRIRETTERRDRLTRDRERAKAELEAIGARIATLADPAEKQAAVETADAGVATAERGVSEAEQAVQTARAAQSALQPDLAAARDALSALEAEARTIARLLNAGDAGLFPGVIESLAVSKGYETALGAALGDDLEASLDASASVHWAGAEIAEGDPRLPDGCTPLADHVRGAPALARRLAQIGIVADDEEGAALAEALRPGQRLVTREGALWRWDGYRAATDAPTAAAQRLAHKNRLAELEGEIENARQRLDALKAGASTAEAETAAAVAAEKAAREAVRKAQGDARAAREALAEAERASGELARRRAVLDENRQRLDADHAEAVAVLAEAESALAAEPDVSGLDAEIGRIQSVVATDRAALAEARADHGGVARERQARRQRLAAIERERANWVARAAGAEQQIEALATRETETREALAAIADAPDEQAARRRELVRQIEKAEKARAEAGDALARAETEARDADKEATDAITAMAEARETRARAEERLSAASERRADAEIRIAETLNCAPHEAFAATGLGPGEPLPDMEPLEKKLDRLRVERERLGAVNLRAEEEQTELTERHAALTGERDDVIAAIAELRSAISALNKEGRERLLAAFDVVQDHFTRLFTHLFGGGTAELQLVESDDPLEAGLEIMARPPGKKPQTMTLLSGGEQALTAMALIFAVFLTNPAPICVLDEVDAPLDDHNVERFCDLMDQMVAQTDTRFVLITHNPITMARMNRLFGVTMAEQGVSQLVSVDLGTAEELREAS